MNGLRLLYRRASGLRCAHWPCRRCNRAGRTGWRSREQGHRDRIRTAAVAAVMAVLLVLPGVAWVVAL